MSTREERARELQTRILTQVPRMTARDVCAAWVVFEEREREHAKEERGSHGDNCRVLAIALAKARQGGGNV